MVNKKRVSWYMRNFQEGCVDQFLLWSIMLYLMYYISQNMHIKFYWMIYFVFFKFSLRISEESWITQDISLDAVSPFICFHTQVRLTMHLYQSGIWIRIFARVESNNYIWMHVPWCINENTCPFYPVGTSGHKSIPSPWYSCNCICSTFNFQLYRYVLFRLNGMKTENFWKLNFQ